ncbi:MAG: hypothetical protein DJ555_05050 [Desulfurococcaceae archaeon]|jgi:hypothetical protein|nr:MAG: hypothetical protein DJ555_05050 [Desulfurococcaceae archaeon]
MAVKKSGGNDSKARRRVFITVAAALAGAAIGIATFLRLTQRPPVEVPKPTSPTPATVTPTPIPADISASRVDSVPIDPDDPKWNLVKEVEFTLDPQAMVRPFEPSPGVKSVKVKALYDAENIAFRIEWADKTPDFGLDVDRFSDRCAVMLLKYPIPDELAGKAWMMGTPEYPATMLVWEARLQLEAEKGLQDITDMFPNIAIDAYPPYKGTVKEVEPKPIRIGEVKGEEVYLAAFAAGNPITKVRLERKPVEKIIGKGPGTIVTARTQDANGKGKWSNGVWSVVIVKRLRASDKDQGEIELTPGNTYHIAFAVWEGSKGERGSRKGVTSLLTLRLE